MTGSEVNDINNVLSGRVIERVALHVFAMCASVTTDDGIGRQARE